MPFAHEQTFPDDVQDLYGHYHSTFRSENGQIIAHLFERDGWLVAHVSFAPGFDATNVTDAYWSEPNRYSQQHGFAGKLKTILS